MLKDNQGNLFEYVKQIFAQAQAANFAVIEHDFEQTVNKEHGRVEIRRCWTMGQVEQVHKRWYGAGYVHHFVSVRASRSRVAFVLESIVKHECQNLGGCNVDW